MILATMAFGAGSKIVEGKIEAAPEGEAWVLRIGTEAVPVALEKKTRFWANRAAADAKAFKVGDAVVARIAPDESPAAVRELADKASWDWLEKIRKGVREATVKGYDGKKLTVTFADGTEMAYRATDKSKITLDGKEATLGEVKTGQKLWMKGRTLPSLDIWLVAASDKAIAEAPKKTPTKKADAPKHKKLPASGKLEGEIDLHWQGQHMFDMIIDGVRMHVSYVGSTAFTFGGTKCGPNELVHGRRGTITYKRDQYGRIMASKVEIR